VIGPRKARVQRPGHALPQKPHQQSRDHRRRGPGSNRRSHIGRPCFFSLATEPKNPVAAQRMVDQNMSLLIRDRDHRLPLWSCALTTVREPRNSLIAGPAALLQTGRKPCRRVFHNARFYPEVGQARTYFLQNVGDSSCASTLRACFHIGQALVARGSGSSVWRTLVRVAAAPSQHRERS
jgi:hypothetical protein